MIESSRFLELKDQIRVALAAADFESALRAADDSVVEARESGDTDCVDLATCNRSMVLIMKGNGSEELSHLKPILIRCQNPVVGFAAAYATAQLYRDRRDFKKAIFYARIARDKSQLIPGHPARGHAFNQLGTVCLDESRIPEAIEAFEKAVAIFEEGVPLDLLARALADDNLGYCYFLDGRHQDGFDHCQRALKMFVELGAEAYTAQPHLDLCFGHLETQSFAEAKNHGRLALELSRKHDNILVLKNSLYLLGEACHLSGDMDGADECFDELSARYPEVRYLKDLLFAVDLKKVINLRL